MATAQEQTKPAWQANVTWASRSFPLEVPAPAVKHEMPVAAVTEQSSDGAPDQPVAGAAVEPPEAATEEELIRVRDVYVDVSRPGTEDRIRFRVNRRAGRSLSFTDAREEGFGSVGTTGIWGTLPPQRPGRRVVLTPTAFTAELARLVGFERAGEIVRSIQAENCFPLSTTSVRHKREAVSR